MRNPVRPCVLLVAALLLLACGDDEDPGGGGASGATTASSVSSASGSAASTTTASTATTSSGGGEGGAGGAGGGGAVAIEWSACPLYVDQPDGTQAECATVAVPLRWSDPDGETIDVFVQRLASGSGEARGQLWLLEGGPGGSGADFDWWMEDMRDLDPTLDLYTVDHRGVGRSTRLDCPAQESPSSAWGTSISPTEAAACHATLEETWGDGLAEFTTTAAARDLGRLIERAAQPGEEVFVYGVSYGTYWAHRYLQVHPDQATAVILDSIAPPSETFVEYDEDFDAVGRDLLDLCAGDTLCAEKLGPDPWTSLEDLHGALDDGHCAELTETWGLDAATLRTVHAVLLMSPLTRTYLPAMIYRHARCAPQDVAAIEQLLTVLFATQETTYYDTLSSDALFYNVALSELWPNEADHPTAEEIAESDAGLLVSTGLTPRMAETQGVWSAYPDDAFVAGWADTDVPLLMMNGDLDPQTPIWVAGVAADHFTGPYQSFLTVPRAAHCVTDQTPVAEDGALSCGMQLLLGFLDDPTSEPDTSCYSAIPEETFTGVPAWNEYLLGTTDLWENDAHKVAAAPAMSVSQLRLLQAVQRRAREQLRRATGEVNPRFAERSALPR